MHYGKGNECESLGKSVNTHTHTHTHTLDENSALPVTKGTPRTQSPFKDTNATFPLSGH